MEALLRSDPGRRSVAQLAAGLASGQLEAAVRHLLLPETRRVGVFTGFPCLQGEQQLCENDGPSGAIAIGEQQLCENDGPSGAIAITRALFGLTQQQEQHDKQVVLVVDSTSRQAVEAAARFFFDDEKLLWPKQLSIVNVEAAPADLDLDLDHAVAVECAGPAADGCYYTMRARDISAHCSTKVVDAFRAARVSTAIGDGGNELGLGAVRANCVAPVVPHGETIACVVPATYTVVAGVSNWGGWAMAALLGLDVSVQQERDLLVALRRGAGVLDGVRPKCEELTVDGMSFDDVHAPMLRKILQTAAAAVST